MRRILAITLLLVFGSPLIVPLFAASADPQASLPACCRRAGAHHCGGLIAADAGAPALQALPCPAYPAHSTAPQQSAAAFALPAAGPIQVPRVVAQRTVIDRQASQSAVRANFKRGPPAISV